MKKKRILILGATGSVGRNAVKTALALKDRTQVVGIAANTSAEGIAEIAAETGCKYAFLASKDKLPLLEKQLPSGCKAGTLDDAAALAASDEIDIVLAAITGIASLKTVLAAIRAGKTVALATKEIIVSAGDLIMPEIKKYNATLIPVDSEHSAVFQCMQGKEADVKKIILTCSGGPFRTMPKHKLANMTAADALNHPVWSMGKKITVDSATLMNKAFEIIEAHYLFSMPEEKIDAVIHPQSVIHSLVEFNDNSVAALLSAPDMRFPIQFAFTYPERIDTGLPSVNLAEIARLDFEAPDETRFPSLGYARQVLRAGGTAGAVFEASNGIAVERFLNNEIKFYDVYAIVEEALMKLVSGKKVSSIDEIIAAADEARKFAAEYKVKK